MAKLRIGRDLLKSALDRAILTDAERATIDRLLAAATAKGPVTAEVTHLPQQCLRALLDDSRLSPNQRAALILHHYAGYSTREIGQILGCSAATVRVHLSQGRRRLRSLLEVP